jgi:excisionase family DNA binding protein
MHDQVSVVSKVEVEPILCSVPNACAIIGLGMSGLYELIGAGKIVAVKSGTRTLIRVDSLHKYANGLPSAKVAPPRHRKPQHLRQTETPNP